MGRRKVNYKMRDAGFSRQRYWGEPFPIVWKDGIAYPLDEKELPLELPYVENYKPGPEGEGPLANINEWTVKKFGNEYDARLCRSSWYFLRYMDPHNEKEFCNRKASDYWGQVDLYIGGTEHAVGHLLYSRMWTKALYDLGFIGHDEPYKKLVNQGMIQGSSRFVYRIHPSTVFAEKDFKIENVFVSAGIREKFIKGELSFKNLYEKLREVKPLLPPNIADDILTFSFDTLHVDVSLVDGVELDIDKFKEWRNGEYANAEFILEEGKYICGTEVEKMSKSKFNTVNPDELVWNYGADTFRMYEMFLGPVEMSKPWDTKGIEGVHRFLKKLWRLFFKESNSPSVEGGRGRPYGLTIKLPRQN